MALTTTSQLSTNITGAYDKRLLDRLQKRFIFMGYGEERPVPANSGATITLRRYSDLAVATTALTEGVTPGGSQLSKTDLTITCAQYGDYVTLSDWLDMTGLDPKIIRPLDILSDQAGWTLDTLARNGMIAGTQLAVGSNSAATYATVDSKLKDAMIAWAVNLLRRTNVDFIREKITGTSQGTGGTQAIDPGYVFIGHVDMETDIRALTGFIATRHYAQPGKAVEGEIGSVGYVRFVLTPQAKVTAATGTTAMDGTMRTALTGGTYADVYTSVLFGKGYFANSKIGNNSVKSIVKSFGSAGTADPLDQRSTVGWKATYGCSILDDRRGVTFYTAASASAVTAEASAGTGVGSGDTLYKSYTT